MKFYNYGICNDVLHIMDEDISCVYDMKVIIPNISGDYDAHMPVIKLHDDKVLIEVSYIKHPMIPEHYIKWIAIKTNNGFYIKYLKPYEEPKAFFKLDNEYIENVYEYCSIHHLWQSN
ncbi:MAG: desulfoferrodoxin family protein [Anaeroplasmataceae bacterium]